MLYVIGTGPTAISAATALVNAGQEVAIIDPGLSLARENEAVKSRLGAQEPEEWNSEDVAFLKQGMVSTTKGIPKKLVYASDYVYRETRIARGLRFANAKMVRSFALGGLSNVWGACILPYPDEELVDWPVRARELAPHFEAVLSFVWHAGQNGSMESILPTYSNKYQRLPLSRQAQELFGQMEMNGEELRGLGISFGASRIAMDAEGDHRGDKGCRQCGMCLYGCPYGLIYSSASSLKQLLATGKVKLLDGFAVDRLEERNSEVVIHARNVHDGKRTTFVASQVFLGAGVLETARIMLETFEAVGRPVRAKHSDRFVLPFLRFRGTRGVMDEKLHTLCQLFMELHDPEICKNSVHLQLYTYNDLFLDALKRKSGPLYPLAKYPIRMVLERLIVMFGYLPPDVSSELTLTLTGIDGDLLVEGHPNDGDALE